jgi:2-octaprenyl-6-methoxyphenol hydroxylase
LAGLVAAIGFARAGFSVVCGGAADRLGQGRTVALLDRSIDFLKALDVWREAEPLGAPLRALRIVDDAGSLFQPRPVEFRAEEIGLTAFGAIGPLRRFVMREGNRADAGAVKRRFAQGEAESPRASISRAA